MGRMPSFPTEGLRRGAWTAEEDRILIAHVQQHGGRRWRTLPDRAGLQRCGKSCRLRWLNYLRPDIKRGNFSDQEEELIVSLQSLLGNKWSKIARRLPGRTDNQIKNYWNTKLKKRVQSKTSQAHASGPQERKKPSAETAAEVEARAIHAEDTMGTETLATPQQSSTDKPAAIYGNAREKGESSACDDMWDFLRSVDDSPTGLMDAVCRSPLPPCGASEYCFSYNVMEPDSEERTIMVSHFGYTGRGTSDDWMMF